MGVAHSTVGRIVQQAGLNRWSSLEPTVAVHRYVYPHPGDLVHLDIKRLGRFRRPGHRVTGNRRLHSPGAGWEYVHVAIDDPSRVGFADLRPSETAHSATRAYTPQTNGKAERFIQSALREWAYAHAYDHSNERAEYLPGWLHRYNWHRPHASLKYQPPIHSLNIPLNNVVGLHT